MHTITNPLSIAQGLERAYRMAMGLEAATRQKLEGDPPFAEFAQWLFAAELLSLLDELRCAAVTAPSSIDH